MPKLFFATLCDEVLELKGGKVCLIGLFDRFIVQDFRKPLRPFRLFAKIAFESAGDYPLEIEFRREEGQPLFRISGSAQVEKEDEVTRSFNTSVNMAFENLTLPAPGHYQFAIRVGGKELDFIPVQARPAPVPLVQ